MSDSCSSGGCSGCPSASSCGVSEEFESLLVDQNQFSDIKKVIGVISGKGGVNNFDACNRNDEEKKGSSNFRCRCYRSINT